MGGFGSGRYGFLGEMPKRTVEKCIELNISDWNRFGYIEPSSTEVVRRFSIAGENFVSRYSIAWIRCNYGGQRPWFVCPRCSQRVGKLYKPYLRSPFWCRHCHNLTYKSCQESGNDFSQAIRQIEKLKRKLGAKGREVAAVAPTPGKPKGMHWDTYLGILDELRSAYVEMDIASIQNLQKVVGTLERVLSNLDADSGCERGYGKK